MAKEETYLILLDDDVWEDAQNMELEYQECECEDAECDGECKDMGDLLTESHISRHELWRTL